MEPPCAHCDFVVQVYEQLRNAGLQPNGTTYTALISVFGKAGQLDKAMDTFNTMVQQGLERSVITYSALMSACEKAGRWELAFELFSQMQRDRCKPNTVTYNSLIMACQQGNNPCLQCAFFTTSQALHFLVKLHNLASQGYLWTTLLTHCTQTVFTHL